MNVLVACEESQVVCKAFREMGHEAFSCDIVLPSGALLSWHILGDVIPLLDGDCGFYTLDGKYHFIKGQWDIIIAHPPCTFLTVSGNRWFNVSRYGDSAILRQQERQKAIGFFLKFVNARCQKIAIENPIGVMSSLYRKPDQIIEPYFFGDPFEKKTCLWLKGLPPLTPVDVVKPPARVKFSSGKSMPSWYADCFALPKDERVKIRSKTFPGIANAMATQWGNLKY